jgi:hypothetical protein
MCDIDSEMLRRTAGSDSGETFEMFPIFAEMLLILCWTFGISCRCDGRDFNEEETAMTTGFVG